jgi:glycosyltransferase involved in cell wall biosynthesis
MNKAEYRGALQTIVLCERAKDLVCNTYGVARERVHVIHNWADGTKLFPRPKAETKFAAKHGLVEPFTVLYSGNLGLYYDFETLLQAAAILKDEPFRLVFAGGGGKREWLIEQVKSRGLTNTTVHPYVPAEELNDSLNACDVSMVTIAKGIEGISFPSKLYSSLAVGKAVVAVSEANSELRDIVTGRNAGRWCLTGDGAGLAAIFRELMANKPLCEEMGRNARSLFEERFTRAVACRRYAEVFEMAAREGR